MGMAASQVRLLQLTGRKNDIGRQLSSLSLQKTSLTREMQKVSKNYQNAISAKTLKWSNNSGVSYVDLSYSNLMRPGEANQNTPYLITNQSGKVVVDDKYEKYASMISADGSAGGDYESNRAEILSGLTGISADRLNSGAANSEAVDVAADKVNQLQEEVDVLEGNCTKKLTEDEFLQNCFGEITGFRYELYMNQTNNVADDIDYCADKGSGHWRLTQDPTSSKTRLQELLDQLSDNVMPNLSDEDQEAFQTALDETYEIYCNYIDSAATENTTVPLSIMTSNSNYYCLRVDNFIDCILDEYVNAGGKCEQASTGTGISYYSTVDRDSEKYKAYETKRDELEAAKAEHEAAVNSNNQSFTAEEESAIDFYDQIFTAIAEKGWTCNPDVSDSDYLNQMLQNNQYYITTMSSAVDKNGEDYYEYSTSTAANFDRVYPVNDTNAQNEALAQYEYEKSIINEKESRIDTRMQDLETEQSAINEMIKGIETVRNDNTERTFSIFS